MTRAAKRNFWQKFAWPLKSGCRSLEALECPISEVVTP
jgi:hypothetical protein